MSGKTSAGSLAHAQQAMVAALHDDQPDAMLALVADGPRPAAAQLAVYRSMYWVRLADALASDYPTVRRRLGEALFQRIAVTHARRHPSRHPSLAWLGRDFEATLASLGQDVEAELARLEWARCEAFWSPDARVAGPELLGALGERLGDAVLALHPSLRRVQVAAGVAAAVEGRAGAEEASGDGADVPVRLDRAEVVAVWRQAFVDVSGSSFAVLHAGLSPAEADALARAQQRQPVASVCEAFASEPDPGGAAVAALVGWVSRGWVTGVRAA